MKQKENIKFFLTTRATWRAMYEDCLNAKTSIELEQYIFNNDRVGNCFLRLFLKKAQEGIKVRLILDKIGSYNILSSPLLEKIREKGGETHIYNPINWLNLFMPFTWFPRNHAKVLIVDSKVAYTGGVCISKIMYSWRDTQVRIIGDLVADIKRDFEYIWKKKLFKRKHKPYQYENKPTRYVTNFPHANFSPIYRELLREIKKAKYSVYFASPFFSPPFRLRRAIYRAMKRGVDVRLIAADKSDVRLADLVARSYFPRFIKKGMRIYLYKKNVLHAKYMVVDGKWATIGSTNLDYLSLLHNRESNLITTDKNVVDKLSKHFKDDLKASSKVSKEYWGKVTVIDRILGFIARILRKMI